jgi:acetoacetate decarboxylase
MQTADLVQNVFVMALTSPSLPRAAYHYSNRRHLIIIYHTERAELVS